jgi:hypothetical protein
MTVVQSQPNRYLDRPSPSSLADVINTILDKGLVIDIYVRVSLVGIELLTIDARIVIASVDTYLRFAEAVNRLDLGESDPETLPDLMGDITSGAAKSKTSGAIEGAKDKLGSILGSDDEDQDEEEPEEKPAKKTASRSRSGSSGSSRGRSRSKA